MTQSSWCKINRSHLMIINGFIIMARFSDYRKRAPAVLSHIAFTCAEAHEAGLSHQEMLVSFLLYRLPLKRWNPAWKAENYMHYCCTLSLCYDCGPSWTAYLPPSLHYSHHGAKWRQTGIDSVWVQRPTAFTRRALEHLDISLAIIQPGPYFLISIHLSDWFWPKSHQLLYYGAPYIL